MYQFVVVALMAYIEHGGQFCNLGVLHDKFERRFPTFDSSYFRGFYRGLQWDELGCRVSIKACIDFHTSYMGFDTTMENRDLFMCAWNGFLHGADSDGGI